MNFMGLDLAWGTVSPTGVAVLDDAGRLVHLSAHRSDEDIVAALAPYAGLPCLAGIDAPLVVRNPTGNRPCEAALNRDFAAFDAGAHPANTSRPHLAAPRGAHLARTLGMDFDPSSRAPRRAVEVYPHAATVALFRLGRTLKYKQKKGRTLTGLREELLRLMHLLDGLRDADPPLRLDAHGSWKALRGDVERATRKSELRRAEDQVDAVVCAYVALLAERRPDLTTLYGDYRNGYIVTPTLPGGHRPWV